jgi:hypothetical protein
LTFGLDSDLLFVGCFFPKQVTMSDLDADSVFRYIDVCPLLYSNWFQEADKTAQWLEFAHNHVSVPSVNSKRACLRFARDFALFILERPQIRALSIIDSPDWVLPHVYSLLLLVTMTKKLSNRNLRTTTDLFTLHVDVKRWSLPQKIVEELDACFPKSPWLSLCTDCRACKPGKQQRVRVERSAETRHTETGHTMRRVDTYRRDNLNLRSQQLNRHQNWRELEHLESVVVSRNQQKQFLLPVHKPDKQIDFTVKPRKLMARTGSIHFNNRDLAIRWTSKNPYLGEPLVQMDLELSPLDEVKYLTEANILLMKSTLFGIARKHPL